MADKCGRTAEVHRTAMRLRLVVQRAPATWGPARWRVFPNGPRTVDYQEGGHLATYKTLAEVAQFLAGYEAGSTAVHLALAPFVSNACGR